MNWLRHCAAAVRFLTIIPLAGTLGTAQDDLACFFPVVGLIIGVLSGGLTWIFYLILPPLTAAVFSTAVLAFFSGALHLDGLADTADGFFSSRPKERILEIMRDSRIGAMGVIALVLVLVTKISCLAALVPNSAVKSVVLMPVIGRVCLVVMMAILPYVRPDGGLGSLFYTRTVKRVAYWSMPPSLGFVYWVTGTQGLFAAGLTFSVVLFFAAFCRNKIGGATGDTLGAACELAETCMVLGFVISSSQNTWILF
jgi:adenosylcobinamide-GDP ribazoletransferase